MSLYIHPFFHFPDMLDPVPDTAGTGLIGGLPGGTFPMARRPVRAVTQLARPVRGCGSVTEYVF